MDEATVVEQAKYDMQSFEILYDRYADAIYTFILYKVEDVDSAQDLTARTWTQALAKISTYEDRQKGFSAWLYTIASNEISSHYRRNKRYCPWDWLRPEQQWVESSIEAKIEHDEQLELLYRALSQLSKRDKDVLELRYLEEFSTRETAMMLDDTPDNIAVRASRAKVRLFKQMGVLDPIVEVGYV